MDAIWRVAECAWYVKNVARRPLTPKRMTVPTKANDPTAKKAIRNFQDLVKYTKCIRK